jgi:hypothetical protein
MNMEELFFLSGWQVRNIVTQATMFLYFIRLSDGMKSWVLLIRAHRWIIMMCSAVIRRSRSHESPIQASAYELTASNEALNSAGYSDHDSITISASFLQIKCIKKAFAKWIEHEIFSNDMVSQWTHWNSSGAQGSNWCKYLLICCLLGA